MTRKILLAIVLIPFITLCLLIARAELHINQSKIWHFEVQGYDPRDLLRGHYLRFTLNYDIEHSTNQCSGTNCCLCLTDVGNKVPKVTKKTCVSAKNQCDGYINDKLARKLNRYYIGEQQAKQAEKILREARSNNSALLSLAINAKGEPQITDMIIDGQSLTARLKQSIKLDAKN